MAGVLGLDDRELVVLRVGGLKGLLYFAEGGGFTGENREGHGGLAKGEVDDEGVTGRGGKNEIKGGLHKRVIVGGGGRKCPRWESCGKKKYAVRGG